MAVGLGGVLYSADIACDIHLWPWAKGDFGNTVAAKDSLDASPGPGAAFRYFERRAGRETSFSAVELSSPARKAPARRSFSWRLRRARSTPIWATQPS
eukprot:5983665-Pyramimonas_sp.AAC.1